VKRWPLLLLALPAAVATWSGWVGLGEKTGFGVVKLLPGILDDFEVNTAITLPIGVEAYAAFALSAWLAPAAIDAGARRFAKWSALGSLVLGMAGQVAYHLLETAGYAVAPTWVTAVVSCLPVLVLGMGAALGHMLARPARAEAVPAADRVGEAPAARAHRPVARRRAVAHARYSRSSRNRTQVHAAAPTAGQVHNGRAADAGRALEPSQTSAEERFAALTAGGQVHAETTIEPSLNARYNEPPTPENASANEHVNGVPDPAEGVPGIGDLQLKAASKYFAELANGGVPPVRQIKTELNVGTDKARAVRVYLEGLANR
jgi:hypothetical protein